MTGVGRFAALALLSAGGLLFEIALTRILSALWFDSFVYVLLSVAVLGVGIGAALATAAPALRARALLPLWLALAGLTAASLVPVLIVLAELDARAASYALVAVPYVCIGLVLAALFAADAEDSPRLYLADLAGAGAGGLLAAPALNALGGIGAALAAAVLLGAGAPLLAARPRHAWWAAAAPGAAAVLVLLHGAGLGPELEWRRIATPKPIVERLAAGADLLAARWDALARTDLVVDPDGTRVLYLDGGAGSIVPNLAAADAWARDVGAFAFAAVRPRSAFLLGSGGGLDLALAGRAGVRDVVAAEVNRGSIEFSRAVAPQLYADDVTVLVDEGRSALRRAGSFDLILLSQTVTQNAELHGIALTENALYTVEAFQTYLDHLSPGGALALKLYDELTLTRALTTAVAALAERGRTHAEAARHLFAILDPRASPPVPLLLVREGALARDDAVAWARMAEQLGFGLLYVPGLLEPPPLDALAAGSAGLSDMIAASPDADLTPPRDHRPFFWEFEPGVPRALRPLLRALAGICALAVALWLFRLRSLDPVARWGLPAALLLGAGFMLAEIALLQRVQLLVGRPTLALGATLGTLLISAGVGSAWSGRWAARPARVMAGAAAAVAVVLAGAELAWPAIADAFEARATAVRLLVALVPVAIVALPMGMPFPQLLRTLGRGGAGRAETVRERKRERAPRSAHVEPRAQHSGTLTPAPLLNAPSAAHGSGAVAAAWAVNGFASVVGAVGATTVAVVFGFPAVAGLAVACYVLTAAAAALSG